MTGPVNISGLQGQHANQDEKFVLQSAVEESLPDHTSWPVKEKAYLVFGTDKGPESTAAALRNSSPPLYTFTLSAYMKGVQVNNCIPPSVTGVVCRTQNKRSVHLQHSLTCPGPSAAAMRVTPFVQAKDRLRTCATAHCEAPF